jgi:anhydro-N-acetylmuramic acid kinase
MISRSGNCYPDLLEQLNALPFYQKNYPKSLGFEFVKETILPLIKLQNPIADKLNSFTKHIAIQIAASLPSKGKLLVTGGGAYNDFLIEMIQEQLPKWK